jgi:hypothetical protein
MEELEPPLWDNPPISNASIPMTQPELTKEERILRAVKRVLTDVAKDTHAPPGMKHPLSQHTIDGIRECLNLIAAREAELAEEAGRPSRARPEFVDEPKTTHVVRLRDIKSRKDDDDR